MHDVIIIGGGVVGTTIARELSKYQLDILLLEKENDVSMGATKANSAIVHGGYAESHDKVKGRLCYKGRVQFAELSKELGFGFDPIGSLVLAFEEEQKVKLEAMLANGIKNGLEDLSIIEHDEIMELEPNVNPEVKYALYCQGAGVTVPFEMCIAMMENAIHNGAKLKLNTEVTGIKKDGDGFSVKTSAGKEYLGRYLINAAGVASDKVSAMVGVDDFTITPRSGEYLLMVAGSGSLLNTVCFQMPTKMGKGILVTPTYYGNLLLGPDAINEAVADKDTHCDRLLKIYKEAQLTTEKLDIRKFIRSFTGVRAVASTDDFIIGETEVPGFINVAGIQSPGMTSSPAIAQMMVEILAQAGLELEEDPDFDPHRKAIADRKELKPLKEIKDELELPLGDPRRMICRDEQIDEATILDAMRREIPVTTIDGIKRRTRAGMGWCQGTYCRPRVAEVMSQELGFTIDPQTDVEHSGINRVGKNAIVDYIQAHLED